MLTLYEATYALTGIFGTYIIYKFMRIFFEELCTSKKIEILSYGAYYVLSTGMFFLIRIPIFMMIANISLFFLLTFNYYASFKKRILFSFLACFILMLAEVMVVVFTGYLATPIFENTGYNSVVGVVILRIVSLFLVSIIGNFKNIKKDIPVPNFYWFSTVFISLGSLYLFLLFLSVGDFDSIQIGGVVFIILTINFMMIILYDNLYKAFSIKTETLLLEQQNKSYEKQLELMQKSFKTTQILRHDMKNHMITLKNLYEKEEKDSFHEYIDRIIDSMEPREQYSNSENHVIDSILNFKLQGIVDMGIKPEVEITIPPNIGISAYDSTVILGNLLDNAIAALKESPNEKELSIKMKYSKSNIIITMENSFNGRIKEKEGRLLSLKRDVKNHGLGLKSIEETVNKNDGHMEIEYDDTCFKVMILLPAE